MNRSNIKTGGCPRFKCVFAVMLMGMLMTRSYCVCGESESAFVGPEWPKDCVDDYSKPLVYKPLDFLSGANLYLSGNVVDRATKYNHNRIQQVTFRGEKWISWEFNKKADDNPFLNFNYQTKMKHGNFPVESENSPQRFMITILNNSNSSMKVQDAKSKAYTLAAGEKKNLIFDSDELRLLVTDIEKDSNYNLLLKELVLCYPAFEAVAEIKATESIKPHEEISIHISLKNEDPAKAEVFDLEVREDQWVIWRIRFNQNEVENLKNTGKCVVKRKVPWYLPSGKFGVGMVINHKRVLTENKCEINVKNNNTTLPVMSRRLYQGVPTLFMNGEPFTWSGFATYSFYPGCVNQFGYSNADVFFIATDAGRHVHNVAAPTWYGDGDYNFWSIQENVCKALAANPEAKLVFRTSLLLPPAWLQNYPDAMARIRTEEGLDVIWEETQSAAISIASEQWRRQQKQCLEELIKYCMNQPWSKNVISFFPTGQVTEEWFSWACNDGLFSDYSPVNEKAFVKWCKTKKYDYNRLPDPALRKDSSQIFFPDTNEGKWAAAYNEYYNQLNAQTIEYYAKIIKEVTGNKSLTGTLFGYVIQLAGEQRQSTSGQFNLRKLLDSPYIDYFAGVPLLDFRHLTKDGYDTSVTARASIIAAGKLYNNENDLFSWLHNAHWYTEYDKEDPRAGCISMHRRVNAGNCIYGSPQQWFELFPTWHNDQQLHDDFSLQNKIHGESIRYDRTNLEECVFVIDDDSFIWKSPDSLFWAFTHKFLLRAIALTGAPIDVWLLSDIDKLPARIKFVVIADASAAKPENITKLRKRIEKGDKTFLVIGLPAYINPQTRKRNINNVSELLGFDVKLDNAGGDGRIKLVSSGNTLADLEGAWNLKKLDPHHVSPRVFIDTDDFIVYEDGIGAGNQIELKGGGRLIWVATPPYRDSELLRGWIEKAGVHFYSPIGTFVRASKELVAVTSVSEEDKDIKLTWPENVEIKDFYDGWKGQGQETSCPFKAGQTRLFIVNTP